MFDRIFTFVIYEKRDDVIERVVKTNIHYVLY